jgi:hypothetical protein
MKRREFMALLGGFSGGVAARGAGAAVGDAGHCAALVAIELKQSGRDRSE